MPAVLVQKVARDSHDSITVGRCPQVEPQVDLGDGIVKALTNDVLLGKVHLMHLTTHGVSAPWHWTRNLGVKLPDELFEVRIREDCEG